MGTKLILNIDSDHKERLKKLAKDSGLSLGPFCRFYLLQILESSNAPEEHEKEVIST